MKDIFKALFEVNGKIKKAIIVIVILATLVNLLACIGVDGEGDATWDDMGRGWMEKTREAAEANSTTGRAPINGRRE